MSPMKPTDPMTSSRELSNNRRWRRRQIIATYVAYAVTVIVTSVRAHATLGSGGRAALLALLGLAALAFIVSLVWLVGPSVRYGLSRTSYRQPGPGELKTLRDQGASAKEAAAMFIRPADERQRAIREHAEAVAYRILGLPIGLVVFYVIFATSFVGNAWLPTTRIEQVELFAGLALIFGTLPAAVIAWSEPDPLPEDPR